MMTCTYACIIKVNMKFDYYCIIQDDNGCYVSKTPINKNFTSHIVDVFNLYRKFLSMNNLHLKVVTKKLDIKSNHLINNIA